MKIGSKILIAQFNQIVSCKTSSFSHMIRWQNIYLKSIVSRMKSLYKRLKTKQIPEAFMFFVIKIRIKFIQFQYKNINNSSMACNKQPQRFNFGYFLMKCALLSNDYCQADKQIYRYTISKRVLSCTNKVQPFQNTINNEI